MATGETNCKKAIHSPTCGQEKTPIGCLEELTYRCLPVSNLMEFLYVTFCRLDFACGAATQIRDWTIFHKLRWCDSDAILPQ